MPHTTERDIFDGSGGWLEVHRTADEWEITLVRAAFSHAEIPFKVARVHPRATAPQSVVSVPAEYEESSVDLLLRVVQVVDRDGKDLDSSVDQNEPEPDAVPLVSVAPTSADTATIAILDDFGEILHRTGYGYELRVGPEPYAVVREEDWDEFTELSAQRSEFRILLKNEHKDLYGWLRAEKKMAQFVRLVEATYRGSTGADTPTDLLRGAVWMVVAIAVIAFVLYVTRWLQGTDLPVQG